MGGSDYAALDNRKVNKMDTKFYVEKANSGMWSEDRFESLEEATDHARRGAWRNGQDYYVFQAIVKVAAPLAVNDTKVSKLD